MGLRGWFVGGVLLLQAFVATAPAMAVVYEDRPWLPKRHPGAPLEDEPLPPPAGWRLGPSMTFPYSMGLGLAYLWPGAPATFKVGANWGIQNDTGLVAFNFSDYRLYGSLLYFLVPGAIGGPYVETGLGLIRSSGAVLPVNWPLIPHLGFGTMGRLSADLGWDASFTASGNGLLILEGGLLY